MEVKEDFLLSKSSVADDSSKRNSLPTHRLKTIRRLHLNRQIHLSFDNTNRLLNKERHYVSVGKKLEEANELPTLNLPLIFPKELPKFKIPKSIPIKSKRSVKGNT